MSPSTNRPDRIVQGDRLMDELVLHIGRPGKWDIIRCTGGEYPLWDRCWSWGRMGIGTVATADAILLAVTSSERLARAYATAFAHDVLEPIVQGQFFELHERCISLWLCDQAIADLQAWRARPKG